LIPDAGSSWFANETMIGIFSRLFGWDECPLDMSRACVAFIAMNAIHDIKLCKLCKIEIISNSYIKSIRQVFSESIIAEK